MIALLVQGIRTIRRRFFADDSPALPPLRLIWRWVVRSSPWVEKRGIPVSIGGTGQFRLHPRLVFGAYDYEQWGTAHNSGFQQWMRACMGKRTVFDIGAHIGLYALPASRVLASGGIVHAFEPADINYEYLQYHVKKNAITNIVIHRSLVGSEGREAVAFFENVSVDGTNSVVAPALRGKKGAGSFRELVRTQIRLDDYIEEDRYVPEVIKIDVEGAEYGVLLGAQQMLRRARPLIFLSVHPAHLQQLNITTQRLKEFIDSLGYDVFTSDGVRVQVLTKAEYILTPQQ